VGTISKFHRRLQWRWLPDGSFKATGQLHNYTIESITDDMIAPRDSRWRLICSHNRLRIDDWSGCICPVCDGNDGWCWLMASDSLEAMQVGAQAFENDPEIEIQRSK
jgi:hypothetical protein